MKKLMLIAALFLFGCTESRIRRYSDLLEPHIGHSRHSEVAKILGPPVSCKPDGNFNVCEYRTGAGRNEQVPFPHRQSQGFGPDLSPYEHTDVVQLYYDDFGVLRDWRPIVVAHPQ